MMKVRALYAVWKSLRLIARVNVRSFREEGGEACNVINGTISIMGVKMISAVYATTP